MQGTDYSVSDRQLTLNKAISANSLLKIYRETTTDTIVSWNDASVLRAKDMSLQEVQLLHLAEETADKVFDTGMSTSPTNTNVWDGQYKRITNLLDPQEDGDAVTLRYINSNQNSLINALKSEGAKQNSSIVSTGNTQNTRLTNTGNSYVSTMTTLKGDTTTKANEAKNSATSASSSASTATTKANEAKNSATTASSAASTATTKANEAKNSATTATTKATEANNSAELAKKWAMSDSSPDGVSGTKSSKTWANEAKNSATSATNSAIAAAKSAQLAGTFDPSNYPLKKYTLDLSALDENTFYPVVFDERHQNIIAEIHSRGGNPDFAYNQNLLSFSVYANGWGDGAKQYSIKNYSVFDQKEITIGCLAVGIHHGGACVWLRGGIPTLYTIISTVTPQLFSTGWNGDEEQVATVGSTYHGAETGNANIDIIFNPLDIPSNSAKNLNYTTYGTFEKAIKDDDGQVIKDTYATKKALNDFIASRTLKVGDTINIGSITVYGYVTVGGTSFRFIIPVNRISSGILKGTLTGKITIRQNGVYIVDTPQDINKYFTFDTCEFNPCGFINVWLKLKESKSNVTNNDVFSAEIINLVFKVTKSA